MNSVQLAATRAQVATMLANAINVKNANNGEAGTVKTVNPNQLTFTQLRSDTLLAVTPGYQDIQFSQKPSPNASEKILQLNEWFVVTGIGISVKKLTASPTDVLQVVAKDYTYHNPYVFDGTTEVTTIQALWNALMRIRVNDDIAFPKLHTRDMMFIPQTQEGAPTAAIAGPVIYRALRDNKPMEDFGFIQVPALVLAGKDQIYADLSIGASLDMTNAAEYNYLTVSLRGWLLTAK